MGFFAGLAEGFTTGRKMKMEKEEKDRLAEYRKSEQEYRASRDEVSDSRYVEEREAARRREGILDARYTDELTYSRGRDAAADERYATEQTRSDIRWEAEFGLKEGEAERQESQWNATFNYRQERDNVTDEQWSAQQETVAAAAEESRRRFEKQFEFTSAESDKAAERWKAKFGFDSDRALKADEWQAAMQEYRETRDSITDSQWTQTFSYGQEQAAAAEERWKVEHGFRKDQALTSQQQWEAETAWRKERAAVADEQFDTQLADKRMTTLISAGLTPGGTSKSTSKTDSSAQGIADSVIALKSRVGSAELDRDDKAYFDVILKDPAAAHKIYSFMQEQAAEGNVIDIEDIPSLIQIAGVSEGKSEEAMALLKSNGVEVENQDEFFSALQTLKDYSPTRVVTDISADAYRNPNDIKTIKDQRDLFVDTSIPAAQAMLSNLPEGDPVRNELSRALDNVGSSDNVIKSRAISTIMKHIVTPEHIARLESRGGAFKNLSQNEFLMPYMSEPEAEVVAEQGGGDVKASGLTSTPEPIAATPPTVLDDTPSFDSFGEVEAWRAEGNSGAVSVGGRTFSVDPIEEPAQPEAPVVDDPMAAPEEATSEVEGLANLAKEQGIRSKASLNKFIFQNVDAVPGDRKATNQLQRQMFEELSAILGL